MELPTHDTPLCNHSLPKIEEWLRSQGCEQNPEELNHWQVEGSTWKADLWLDIDQLTVCYHIAEGKEQEIQRSFKYSLSRQDIEAAVFSGP
ncbi:MAG: DUF3143 domain-containing protein [Oscillatoriales cyanobacterium RM2_1_1]|nr:DUF3143 domain-containing protein [Oscillatoriales cyanobacterium SM2_3_0]NJO45776.1 DUF3143 domain-containing protein [Oscillatoriales cyanobacterium RM2_1_1]